MNIYQPNQSALNTAFKSQASLTEQKIVFLEQSLNKAQRDLNDVRFQQNHLKSKREDMISNHQKSHRKLLKQVDELQQIISKTQSHIRIDQLITAFKNNNWNDHIARYCSVNIFNQLLLLLYQNLLEPIFKSRQIFKVNFYLNLHKIQNLIKLIIST